MMKTTIMKTLVKITPILNRAGIHPVCSTVRMLNGRLQPPRKRTVMRKLTVITCRYSPRKNMPNFIAEYSVWNPPTSSCSASARSNGRRFVSAKALMRKIKQPIGWTNIPQAGIGPRPLRACQDIISPRSSDRASMIIPRTERPSGIS